MTSHPEPTDTAMASNDSPTTTTEVAEGPTTELPHRPKPAVLGQDATETPGPSNGTDDNDDGDSVDTKKPNEELVNLLKKKKKKRSKGGKAKVHNLDGSRWPI